MVARRRGRRDDGAAAANGAAEDGERAAAVEQLPVKHFNEKQNLLLRYRDMFDAWACSLVEGLSLLLYGFGSKRTLLTAFMQHLLSVDGEAAAVEVLGYSPHFTVKELLLQLLQATGLSPDESSSKVSRSRRSVAMLAKAVVEDLAESKVTVFLFVNNIEGHNLRSVDCQKLLSDLAALPNVYLVATVDNLAAMALLWDRRLATKLSFHHLHVPTYCSYEDELMYQNEIAFEETDGRRLQAASVVLNSLTQTARSIFRQLAESQMSDHPEGLPFQVLYTMCREQLLLSNEVTLRSHLGEFMDHDLVRLNQESNQEGMQSLYSIPLRPSDVQLVLTTVLN